MQDEFWISSDGKILSQTEKDPTTVELILQFEFEKKADTPKIEPLLPNLQFSERSRLARIGIELFLTNRPEIQNNSILARAEAFVIDREFPSFEFLPNLLQPGTEVGRLFYFPETSKLSSTEIWQAIQKNELKLPETLSVDRFGQIHFTPHRRIYQLPPSLTKTDLLQLISGKLPRTKLDKIQTARDVGILYMPPDSGFLSSCSMFLRDHYAVLHRGKDDFGLHTGAVLLDPVKTFGTNIMLEIYNSSSEVIINPLLSIDLYRSPKPKTNFPKPTSISFTQNHPENRFENDTFFTTCFPSIEKQNEILNPSKKQKPKRLVFEKASPTNPFSFPDSAGSQLKTFVKQKIEILWKIESAHFYRHIQKRDIHFFVRSELSHSFPGSPLIAFYGSEWPIQKTAELVHSLSTFFGSPLSILAPDKPEILRSIQTDGKTSKILAGRSFSKTEKRTFDPIDFFNPLPQTKANSQETLQAIDFSFFTPGTATAEAAANEIAAISRGIRPRVPLVFFTDPSQNDIRNQIETIFEDGKAPAWIRDLILASNDPDEIVRFYRKTLQVL